MLATTLNLASRVHRPSRKPITLPKIAPTKAQADDLAVIYLGIVNVWAQAQPAIVAEYERTLAAMTTDSPSDVQGQIDSVQAEIQRLILLLTPDLRRWALRVESVHRGKWQGGVLSATDIDLSTVLSPFDVADTVDATINWNVSLIRDVSDETRRRIANAVFTGFQQRKSAADIAKEISDAIGMVRARSRRIAGDQVVKLGSRLNQARQEQAGITKFKWRHSAKRHPRSWHLARDGRIYSWADPGIAADDMPGIAPFCGCVAQAYLDFSEES